MFRKFLIAVFTAAATLLETAADAIAATLPPPAADGPRLRLVASRRLWVPVTTAPRNCSRTNVTRRSTFHATIRPSLMSPRRLAALTPRRVSCRRVSGQVKFAAHRTAIASRHRRQPPGSVIAAVTVSPPWGPGGRLRSASAACW